MRAAYDASPRLARHESAALARLRPLPGMEESVTVRLVVGVLLTVVAFVIAGRRLWMLYRLGRTGQPVAHRPQDPRRAVQAEAVEVLGQRKLLKWTVPGSPTSSRSGASSSWR